MSEGSRGAVGDILSAWIDRMSAARVLMAKREAFSAQAATWLELLSGAARGEDWSEKELGRLLALHGRELGAEKRPASAALMQLFLLEEVLEEKAPDAACYGRPLRELMKIVADAHAIGSSARLVREHQRALSDGSPVVRIGDRVVVGFLIGPMVAENIDAVLGRTLRERARVQAPIAILDVRGAEPETDVFHRTLESVALGDAIGAEKLVVTGLKRPADTRAALLKRVASLERLDLAEDLAGYLAKVL